MGRYLERQLALDQANGVLKLYSLKILKVKSIWYVVRVDTENLRNAKTAYHPINHRHIVVIAPEEPRRTLVAKLTHVLKYVDAYERQLKLHDLAILGLELTKHVTK